MAGRSWGSGILLFVCFIRSVAVLQASQEEQAENALPKIHQSGFVLTQWGDWRAEMGIQAIESARQVGARHVNLLVHLCQESKTASEVTWCGESEETRLFGSAQGFRLLRVIAGIKLRGMTFNLTPFLSARGVDSRQWIWPSNQERWFQSYERHILELAQLSEALGATDLILASELTRLFTLAHPWRELAAKVRRVFSGPLSITTLFFQYGVIPFADALDTVGVSGYFPLAAHESIRSVDALEAAWRIHETHLTAISKLHNKPIYFVEVGYPATNVAAFMPWDFDWSRRRLDEDLQARCFEAFSRVWKNHPRLAGFQIWGLSADPKETPLAFNPLGKLAEQVVRRLFSTEIVASLSQ